jgi:hypothetical protein
MSYVATQEALKLPLEIIVLIITHLPTANCYLQCRCLSHKMNLLLQSPATRKGWLLNLSLSPSVLIIANKMQIGLPFEHARLAMEHGVNRTHLKGSLALSEHYLNNAIPPFLYNICLSKHYSPEALSVLEEIYLQYFVFREAKKRRSEFKMKWIDNTFGKVSMDENSILIWVDQAFEISIGDFYTTIAKRISV